MFEVGRKAHAAPATVLEQKRTVMIDTELGDLVVEWTPRVASAPEASGIAAGRDVGSASVELDSEPYPFHEPFWFAVGAFQTDIEIVRG